MANDKTRDENQPPPIEEIKPGEAVDLCERLTACLSLAKGHAWQDRDAWEKLARALAKRFDSGVRSAVMERLPAEEVTKALRELADGYTIIEGVKYDLSIGGRTRRESIVADALARLSSASTEWQPIETAPKTGPVEQLLLYVPELHGTGGKVIAHWAQGGGEDQPRFGPAWFYWTGHGFNELPHDHKPTHWMRLPHCPADWRDPVDGRNVAGG